MFRVCAFTGGSAAGAMQAAFADIIEQRTGRAFGESFHVIGCCSVGALNGLPLSIRKEDGQPFMTAEQLTEFWPGASEKILKVDILRAFRSLKGKLFPVFDSAARHSVVKSVLGEYKLSDLQNDVIIIGHDVDSGNAHLFYSTYARGDFGPRTPKEFTRDRLHYDYFLTDVAMATTALPGAFESHKMANRLGDTITLADGGISKNNLINITTRFANNLYGRDIDIMAIVFGTGVTRLPPAAGDGLSDWTRRISEGYQHLTSSAELHQAMLDPCIVHFYTLDTLLEQKAAHLPALSNNKTNGSFSQVKAIIENTKYAAEHEVTLKYQLDRICEILSDPPDQPEAEAVPAEECRSLLSRFFNCFSSKVQFLSSGREKGGIEVKKPEADLTLN